jgi:hypothetical protein
MLSPSPFNTSVCALICDGIHMPPWFSNVGRGGGLAVTGGASAVTAGAGAGVGFAPAQARSSTAVAAAIDERA